VGGIVRVAAFAVAQPRRAPPARVVAGAGALDLDDVGAQIGQVLRAPGAGEHAREVENANAGERTGGTCGGGRRCAFGARSGVGRCGHGGPFQSHVRRGSPTGLQRTLSISVLDEFSPMTASMREPVLVVQEILTSGSVRS